MNNTRRKKLARIQGKLREIQDDLRELMEEEEEYRDNMPENLKESERYEKADEACDNMQCAVDSIDEE